MSSRGKKLVEMVIRTEDNRVVLPNHSFMGAEEIQNNNVVEEYLVGIDNFLQPRVIAAEEEVVVEYQTENSLQTLQTNYTPNEINNKSGCTTLPDEFCQQFDSIEEQVEEDNSENLCENQVEKEIVDEYVPEVMEYDNDSEDEPVEQDRITEDADRCKQKKRKRIHVKYDPTYTKNKENRQFGFAYKGKKKLKGRWNYEVEKPRKLLRNPCACKLGTAKTALQCTKLSEEDRTEIFNKFWQMTWSEKKMYARGLVRMQEVKRRRGMNENSRRNYSFKYYLPSNLTEYRVCKKMFNATLGVSENLILLWLKKDKERGTENNEDDENLENDVNVCNKRKNKDDRINKLEQFLNSLVKMESHYCRASSTKLYLEPNWQSKRELYRFYKESWCLNEHVKPVSLTIFYLVFEKQNLSLYRPKKDQCVVCVGYKSKNINEEEYREHLQLKKEARDEKEKDKISQNSDLVLTMDLQSVLLAPFSKVSLMYYKTKLAVHNFTIYNIKTNDGYCNLWSELDGSVGANEFASILVSFIEETLMPSIFLNHGNIIFWSDGCAAQNRNSVLSNALLCTAIKHKVTIIQKYLYKGHTQMEADSMHSTIERRLRNHNINVPADYVQYCKSARSKPRPYDVKYRTYDFFKDFSAVKYYNSIRPGRKTGDPVVSDLKQIKYKPDGVIEYKLRHSGDWIEMMVRKKTQSTYNFNELPNLYAQRKKIKKEKFDHLQQLKHTLELDYHDFYDNICHE